MTQIIEQQEPISIYENEGGGITIEGFDFIEGKPVRIAFKKEHAQAICDAILAIKNAESNGD